MEFISKKLQQGPECLALETSLSNTHFPQAAVVLSLLLTEAQLVKSCVSLTLQSETTHTDT